MSIVLLTEFRYIALWLACILGRFYHWLTSGWRPPVFWLAATALGVFLAEWLAVHFHQFNLKAGSWFQVWNILALYTLFAILWWAWRARKRVVVEEFLDYTCNKSKSAGDDQSKSAVKGLATILVVRLAQLRELYRDVDEQRAIPVQSGVEGNQSTDATIKVEDVSEFLKDAVSAQSKFSLGPLEIPVGTLMAFIGRLVQGPRIIGSLHKEKELLILTVQQVGGKHSYYWRVDRPLSLAQPADQETYRLDEMVAELAYRMFTDLALGGSLRWRAVSKFSEGLQAYRDCLRKPKDRKLNLKQAEKKFIETLAEDTNFDLVYYNLGVVYTELERTEAAEFAFSQAIEQNPNVWHAYYALLVNRYRCEQYESVIQLCERVITLKPGTANMAKTFHWKGLAQRHLNDLEGAIKSRKKSVALSWKALCIAELKGRSVAEAKNSVNTQLEILASLCLTDLAVAYGYKAKMYDGFPVRIITRIKRIFAFKRAEALFKQALSLYSDADYYFELGKTYHEWQKLAHAVQEYKSAIQISSEKADFWAYLALAYAEQNDRKSALTACGKVLNCASQVSQNALKMTAEAYKELVEADQSERVARMKDFLKEVEKDVEEGQAGIHLLQEKLARYNPENQTWEHAQILFALGRLYFSCNQFVKATGYFQGAIKRLEGKHPQEIRQQGLRAMLARSLLNQGKYDKALREAERALSLDPLSYFEREVLGQVYFESKEFEYAITAWQDALLRRPDSPDIHLMIGRASIEFAKHCRDSTRRSTAFQDATKYLKQALDLYESDEQEQKARVYYLLGIIHLIWIGKYDEAISSLRISQHLGFTRLTSTFFLGYAYLRNKEYNECTEQFNSLLKEAEGLEKDDKSFNAVIELEHGGQMSLGELLASAYWGKAYAYAERDANLEDALKLIEKAQEHIKRLDSATKIQSFAIYPDCKGWILSKLDRIDEAIECLKQAVSLAADAENYLHLALAYERKLQASKDETGVRCLIRQYVKSCVKLPSLVELEM